MVAAIVICLVIAALLACAWRYDRRHPGTRISGRRIKAQRRIDRTKRATARRPGRMR